MEIDKKPTFMVTIAQREKEVGTWIVIKNKKIWKIN